MALTKEQQALELIQKSNSILIASPPVFKIDALSSITGLEHALRKLEKSVHARLPFEVPEHLAPLASFLPHTSPSIPRGDFILKIDTKNSPVRELRYEKNDDVLKIFLTPGEKDIHPEHIAFERISPRYDLIITCLAPDLESLGDVFEKDPQLFFTTPIINIDTDSANEHYGELNLVDITASSSSEIIALLLEAIRPSSVTREIATLLLAGIVSTTDNFRKGNVRPKTFNLAASLMTKGANHETIIQTLYKTRPLNLLKLLGKTLGNVRLEEDRQFLWSFLKKSDFEESHAHPRLIPQLMHDIQERFSSIDTIIIFWESLLEGEPQIHGLASTTKPSRLEALHHVFGGEIRQGFLVMEKVARDPENLERALSTALFAKKNVANHRVEPSSTL